MKKRQPKSPQRKPPLKAPEETPAEEPAETTEEAPVEEPVEDAEPEAAEEEMPAESAEAEETEAVEPEPAAEAEESEPAVEAVEEAAEPETDDEGADVTGSCPPPNNAKALCVVRIDPGHLSLPASCDVLRAYSSRKLANRLLERCIIAVAVQVTSTLGVKPVSAVVRANARGRTGRSLHGSTWPVHLQAPAPVVISTARL